MSNFRYQRINNNIDPVFDKIELASLESDHQAHDTQPQSPQLLPEAENALHQNSWLWRASPRMSVMGVIITLGYGLTGCAVLALCSLIVKRTGLLPGDVKTIVKDIASSVTSGVRRLLRQCMYTPLKSLGLVLT